VANFDETESQFSKTLAVLDSVLSESGLVEIRTGLVWGAPYEIRQGRGLGGGAGGKARGPALSVGISGGGVAAGETTAVLCMPA
jgi:hypothetical protein